MALDPDLHNKIVKAAHAFLVALDLEEIGAKVYTQLRPDESAGLNPQTGEVVSPVEFPCVALTIDGEAEESLPGDTEQEEQIFPLRFWLLDRNAAHNHGRANFYLKARKAATDALKALFKEGAGLAGLDAVYACDVRFGVMIDSRMKAFDFVASSALLRFRYTERRS